VLQQEEVIEAYNTEHKDIKINDDVDPHQPHDMLTSKKKSMWMSDSNMSPSKNRKKAIK